MREARSYSDRADGRERGVEPTTAPDERVSVAGPASRPADCPLCGQGLFRALVPRTFPDGQRLYKCAGCGLVRMLVAQRAARDYWADEAVTLDVYSNDRVRAEMKARYARYLPLISTLCGGPGTLLDAGCGIGNFLVGARDAGWRVRGAEVSEKAAAIARGRGLDVETGRLEDGRWPPRSFDAVTLWDVLPHFDRPAEALRLIHDKLRPGGILFLEIPNEGLWIRAAARGAFALSRGRIDLLRYFYYPDHKFYFTAATLGRLVTQSGFRLERVWVDVTSPTKARLKIAPGRFPLGRTVVALLPAILALLRLLGMGNKLIVAARKV